MIGIIWVDLCKGLTVYFFHYKPPLPKLPKLPKLQIV